jgi:hypothetical protein
VPNARRKQKEFTIWRNVRPSEEGGHTLIGENSETSLLLRVLVFFSFEVLQPLESLLAVKLCF